MRRFATVHHISDRPAGTRLVYSQRGYQLRRDTLAKITLLAGGGAVYVYPDVWEDGVKERISAHQMVLDVAYPADDTTVVRVDVARWEEVRATLGEQGIEVVDTRIG